MRRLFGGGSAPVDWLVVGLGNPGERYARTPHNVGFAVAEELARRWELPKPKQRYAGLFTDGRTGPGGPRVAVLWPQTYMNEAGNSAGPASISIACSSSTTRSTCRSATSARASAAGWPATTA
jgi:peptidyl-tRNA hydrolase, PTH1 family